MELKTSIIIPPSEHSISHDSGVITIGSCFSDVIGSFLSENKFRVSVNPFGTIFNPISIASLLSISCNQERLSDHTFVRTRNKWFNYQLHSEHFSDTREGLEEKFNAISSQLHSDLKDSHTLILTLGTSNVYKLIEHRNTVANCHKLPSSHFSKVILSPDEISESLKQSLLAVKKINPAILVLLTVSPVRHIKDTLSLNSLSKSILRVACHKLAEETDFTEYFPSYEIMMDDLRDYRFYKEDMIHPSTLAEKYIWEKFAETYFNHQTRQTISTWHSLSMALSHKPFDSQSEDYKKFLKNTLVKLEKLNSELNLEQEISHIRLKLQKFSSY